MIQKFLQISVHTQEKTTRRVRKVVTAWDEDIATGDQVEISIAHAITHRSVIEVRHTFSRSEVVYILEDGNADLADSLITHAGWVEYIPPQHV